MRCGWNEQVGKTKVMKAFLIYLLVMGFSVIGGKAFPQFFEKHFSKVIFMTGFIAGFLAKCFWNWQIDNNIIFSLSVSATTFDTYLVATLSGLLLLGLVAFGPELLS